ncbi:/ / ABC-type antimicrobial peptide transport system, ATPase component / 465566:467812 Reverse [Candidatus Hepatoplasma crinochetorum]|uniref:/ / ABC-type antimicrobial peptide transport system, ATPase component / 465566:467812 Reverse n=1 Tax=Candidatus Hepatoplasma crinochetorum TaxID=295596 RepID=A0A0G7ZMX4_9MOLU|nr:/ / ABC-type antimicrobial peptide transport system, ATPase component / 465566:467812 Reverse [Candidatus Hepatoplasma crinochetorum]
MKQKLNKSLFLKINNLDFRDKNLNLIINDFTLNIKNGEIHAFLSNDRVQLESLKQLFIENLNERKRTEEFIFDQGLRYSRANLLLNKNYSNRHNVDTNLYYKFIKSDYARKEYNLKIHELKEEIDKLEKKIKVIRYQLPKSNISLKELIDDFFKDEKRKFFKNNNFDLIKILDEIKIINLNIKKDKNFYKRNLKYINKKYFFNVNQLKDKKIEWKETLLFFRNLNKSWYSLSLKEFNLIKKYSLDQRDFNNIKNEIKRFVRLLISESGEKHNFLLTNPIRMHLFLQIKNLEKENISESRIEYVWKNVLNIIGKNEDKIKENIKEKIENFKNYINNLLFEKSIINTKINRLTYNYLSQYVRNKIKEVEYLIFDIKKTQGDINLKNRDEFEINLYIADLRHYNYQIFILENLRNYFIDLVDFFNNTYFFYDLDYLQKFHKIIFIKIKEIYFKYKNYYDWQIKSSWDRKKLQKYILKKELNEKIINYQKRKNHLNELLFKNRLLINKSKQFFNERKKIFLKNTINESQSQEDKFSEKALLNKNQQILKLKEELSQTYKKYEDFKKEKFNKYEKNLFIKRLKNFSNYLNFDEKNWTKKYKKLNVNEKILVQILNLLIINSKLIIVDDYLLNDFNIQLSEVIRNLNTINQDYKFTIFLFVNNLKFIQLFAKRITFFYEGKYLETINISKDWINKLKNSKSKDLLFYISKDSLKSHSFFNVYKPIGERFIANNYSNGKNKKFKDNHVVYTR